MARPRKKLTDDQIREVETLAPFLSIEQLADYFMMDKNTFYAIMERQPEVSQRYKNGKSKAIAVVAKGLLQQAREGDKVAAMFYLKTQAGWRETSGLDLTNSDRSLTPTKIKIVAAKHDRD